MWAAYGAVEAWTTIFLRCALFRSTFVPPDDRFTLFLLILYPLLGALLGRFALAGLAIAFAANAIATVSGPALAVPLVSAVCALALFRRPWPASLFLIVPIWAAREIGYVYTFTTRAILAGAALLAVALFGFLASKVRWSLKPAGTLAIFAVTMLVATRVDIRPPRDIAPTEAPPRTQQPNIVLIVMDTVRADHLSLYGYPRATTPNLDALAKSATVYTRAWAPSNMTLSTHASLFTGLYGSEHAAHYDEGWQAGRPLPAFALTLAELLAARGYATASIAANYVYLGEEFGLDQGFQHLDALPPPLPFGAAWNFYLRSRIGELASSLLKLPPRAHLLSRPAEAISERAMAFIDRAGAKRRPFFLVLNYMDAHAPCIPPAPFDTMFPGHDASQPIDLADKLLAGMASGKAAMTARQRAHLISQYDGAIAYTDQQIARVLATLRRIGIFDRTLIVVLSDHGEAFGEHGVITHGFTNYDVETRVPLIVKKAEQRTSEVISRTVSLLDVWPLLSGTSHAPFAVITEAFPMRGAAARIAMRRAGTAKIEGTVKTIVNVRGDVESYDVATDPNETSNAAPNETSRRMAQEIAAWRKSLRAHAVAPAPPVDPETLRRLRALGYIQ